MEKKLI